MELGKDYSLNTHEVMDVIGKPCNMILFEYVKDMQNLRDLFPIACVDENMVGRCLINYLYEKNYGHWVGLAARPHEKGGFVIEYFDPYGSFIDGIIEKFPESVKMEHNSDYPYLLKLLYSSGNDVYYNHFPLQSHGKDVATCGRWVGYFLRKCSSNTIDEFGRAFMDVKKETGVDLDDLIADITNDYL